MSRAIKVKKKNYEVELSRPAVGTQCWNYLEDCRYVTSKDKPYELRGLVGEEWVIDEVKLKKSYCFPDGSEIEPDKIGHQFVPIRTRDDKTEFFAKPTHGEKLQIATSWGDVLYANRDGIPHGNGDWIVSMDAEFKDQWIVNGVIFEMTYDVV